MSAQQSHDAYVFTVGISTLLQPSKRLWRMRRGLGPIPDQADGDPCMPDGAGERQALLRTRPSGGAWKQR